MLLGIVPIFAGMVVGAMLVLLARFVRPRATSAPVQDDLERIVEQRTRELFSANRLLVQSVAELDQASREADAQRAEIERANAAKSLFLANISHELRTPLNAIIGFSEIIGKEMFGALHNARYRDYIHDIHGAASHVQSLIDDLLDLSKIEANKYQVYPEWLNLTEVLSEPLRMMRVRATQAGLALAEDFDAVDPHLFADRRALKQMVLNLLSNAVRSTSEGSVILRSRLLPTGEVAVTVEDTGCGIPQEHFDRILLPFEQIDGPASGGTGLGLPLVNALIRLHDGQLDIASEAGKGTRMTLCFPATRVSLVPPANGADTEMCA